MAARPCASGPVSDSELEGSSEGNGLDVAARGTGRHISLPVDVVELELDVAVEIPVQTDRMLAIAPALDRFVVQVDQGVAVHDFPGT